jgi:hypothetical protein
LGIKPVVESLTRSGLGRQFTGGSSNAGREGRAVSRTNVQIDDGETELTHALLTDIWFVIMLQERLMWVEIDEIEAGARSGGA